jgi:hypothetical protein
MPRPVMPDGFAPQIQGYSIGAPMGARATAVAGGAARAALEYNRGPQPFQVTMIMNSEEFSVWTAWFFHIVKLGTVPFDMPLNSGFGPQVHVCTVVPDTYSVVSVSGPLMSVSFVVSAVSRVHDMTAEDAQVMVDLWNGVGDNLSELLDRLAQFALDDTDVLDF